MGNENPFGETRYWLDETRPTDEAEYAICKRRGHEAGRDGMSAADQRQVWMDCKWCGIEFRYFTPAPELQERNCSTVMAHNVVLGRVEDSA